MDNPVVHVEPKPVPMASGAVSGMPLMLLRMEGAALLVATVLAYGWLGGAWWLFALLLLVPDIGMLGYAKSRRVGAVAYNVFHTEVAPAALAAVGLLVEAPIVVALALVWLAHIGMDRMLGYGLKHDEGFHCTHLGLIGPARRG